MTHRVVLVAVFALFQLFAFCTTAAEPVRIAGAVYRGDAVDEALTDLLIVELSGQQDVQTLERRQLQMVLGELSLAALADDAWRQTRLGYLLGLDAFVWVTMRDGHSVTEVVEAATGRGVAVTRRNIEPDGLVDALKSLAAQAAAAAKRGPVPIDKDTPTLVIAKPILESGGTASSREIEGSLLRLAEDLGQAGVAMLHRRLLDDLIVERWMMDKGLTDAQRQHLPMLGAQYILGLRTVAGSSDLVMSLLETRTGRRIGHRMWRVGKARSDSDRAALVAWVRQRIDPGSMKPARPDVPKPVDGDTLLQPETLDPFYRGVLLHNQGRYLDAAERFREAMHADRRFAEPYRWMQSCMVGSGFDEVGEAIGHEVDRASRDKWHGISHPRLLHAAPGVALLGVTAAPSFSSAQRVAGLISVMEGLHKATEAPVFVASDVARLRDEFDALVGLQNVAGTTWRQCPPLLFADTVTAHLERHPADVRVRLCVTHQLAPNRIAQAEIDLQDDHRAWPAQIATAGRVLLLRAADARPAWSRPPLLLSESDLPPAKLASEDYTSLRYLKCVARDGQFTDYLRYPHSNDWFENVIMPGLHRWFVRTLPNDSRVKPAVVFAYVSYYTHGEDWLEAMRSLGRTYPSDAAGVLARLNALLYDMNDENLRQTQAEYEKLLTELERHVGGISLNDLNKYRDTNRLMRRALGMADRPGRLDPGGRSWATLHPGSRVGIRAGGTYPAKLEIVNLDAKPQQQAIVELAVLACVCRKELDIPVATVEQLFKRFAAEPDVLAYFSVTYSNKIFENRIHEMTDDQWRALAELYPLHARAVVGLLRQEPLPFTRQQLGFLIGIHSRLEHFGADNAAFRQSRREVTGAVLQAIEQERLGKLSPLDMYALLLDIFDRESPDVSPLLEKLAGRALAGDPLDDLFWRLSTHWKPHQTPKERMERYLPFYERIRRLHPKMILDERNAWYYFDFGLAFFRGGRFDLADEVLTAIAAWPEPQATVRETLMANTYYLLALLRQQQRNIPEALKYAKLAVEEIGNGDVRFVTGVGLTGSRQGRGSTGNLKSMANELLARLRSNPDAPFEYPFDNRWW